MLLALIILFTVTYAAESGNPFVQGWYADPDALYDNGTYWIYATASNDYEKQTYLDAKSSSDLINWNNHSSVLTVDDFNWAKKAVWAPSPVKRNGKFYLYFAANDIQNDYEVGGIGVGVASSPQGPFTDAIGAPLIGKFYNDAQPIDPAVFIDPADNQAYIYYGGHSHCNVAKLSDDMVSIGYFDSSNTTQFKDITPPNYVEAPYMFSRNGTYYFMWSQGGWTTDSYEVNYAMADNPLGPFKIRGTVLQADNAVAKGPGSNAVIHTGDDVWYIVYHRRPLKDKGANHRVLAYDRMQFNSDGTIQPVQMLVQDNFQNSQMTNWQVYGGAMSVAETSLAAVGSSKAEDGLALLNTNFSSLVYDADISITAGTGDAGLVFWVANATGNPVPGVGIAFDGYYAGFSSNEGSALVTYTSNGTTTKLGSSAASNVEMMGRHHLRVEADPAGMIQLYLNNATTPLVEVRPVGGVGFGQNGVYVNGTQALFTNISVDHK